MEAGASSIAVFPLFLTASTHLAEDVPELVGQVREEFGPELSIELLTNEPLHTRIWENTRRRLDAHKTDSSTTWIVAPYYGSDRYAAAWTDLLVTASDSVQHWGFAGFTAAPIGHIVGASPIPTRDAVKADSRPPGRDCSSPAPQRRYLSARENPGGVGGSSISRKGSGPVHSRWHPAGPGNRGVDRHGDEEMAPSRQRDHQFINTSRVQRTFRWSSFPRRCSSRSRWPISG